MTSPFKDMKVPERILERVRGRSSSFRRVFGGKDGEAVLAYLQNFCFASKPTFSPGIDGLTLAFYDGRRDVFLEIQKFLNLSQADLNRLEHLTAQERMEDYGES